MSKNATKPYAISVPGSVVTERTAPGYVKRAARFFLRESSDAAWQALTEIEGRIVAAGLLTWEQCEQLEVEAWQ